jgi:hypothetical protein
MEQATKFEATGAEEPLFCWEDLSEEDLLELDEALVLSPLQPLPTARLEQAPLEYLAQAPAPARPRAAKRPRRSNDRLGSPYRGVSFQGRTGRCEAHIWVRGTQARRGRGGGGGGRAPPPRPPPPRHPGGRGAPAPPAGARSAPRSFVRWRVGRRKPRRAAAELLDARALDPTAHPSSRPLATTLMPNTPLLLPPSATVCMQVYLGSFFCAEAAAAAYDLAAVSPPAAPPSRLPHRMPVLPGLRRSRCTPLLARALLFNVACTAPAF